MKKLLRLTPLALMAASTFLFSGCVVPVDGNLGYDPGAYPPGNRYDGVNQDAYRNGYRSGRDDAREGRSQKFTRHEHRYDRATKEQFRDGYMRGYDNYSYHNSHPSQPGGGGGGGRYSADVGQGRITISQGGRVVSVIRTASPNIEEWHFKKGQERIVTKSRGNHGPATVELFETRTGVLRNKILAYAIKNGQPEWARGMQD